MFSLCECWRLFSYVSSPVLILISTATLNQPSGNNDQYDVTDTLWFKYYLLAKQSLKIMGQKLFLKNSVDERYLFCFLSEWLQKIRCLGGKKGNVDATETDHVIAWHYLHPWQYPVMMNKSYKWRHVFLKARLDLILPLLSGYLSLDNLNTVDMVKLWRLACIQVCIWFVIHVNLKPTT